MNAINLNLLSTQEVTRKDDNWLNGAITYTVLRLSCIWCREAYKSNLASQGERLTSKFCESSPGYLPPRIVSSIYSELYNVFVLNQRASP